MPYVPHSRYGDRPRITGLDVDPDTPGVYLHWNTGRMSTASREHIRETARRLAARHPELGEAWKRVSQDGSQKGPWIPGTAVEADLENQSPATVPVTHYYDVARNCRDCGRPFLFFALEQKAWYEELGFPLEADCVRCEPCRKELRALKALRKRYEELAPRTDLSPDEDLEITFCRLELLEERIFGARQRDAIRSFLRRHPEHPRAEEIRARLERLDSR